MILHTINFQEAKTLHFPKFYCKPSDKVLKKSKELKLMGIHKNDAIHIACAIISNCDYFITTDYDLIKKNSNDIKILNPIDFIYEMEKLL